MRRQLLKEIFFPIVVATSGSQQSAGGGSSYEDQVPAASGDNGLIGFHF